MHTTITGNRLHRILGRAAAAAFLAATGTLGLHAQQSAGIASLLPPVNMKASLAAPLNLSTPDLGYSSSVGSFETANAVDFSLSHDAAQPPPRRRYSRPNYNDSRTNPDGSAKYTFFVGGGFSLPTGGTHNYLSPGWNVQFGGGRNFNKTFGVLAQFDYDRFGFQTATLNNLLAIYNDLGAVDQNGNPLTSLGGTSHIWSLTLDPVINYYTSDTWGAYAIAGVGFYHKTANFTIPGIGTYCDPYYGCYQVQANQTIDKYTSNAFGANGGLGITYKFSRFASTKFYAEARYVWVDNQKKPYSDGTEPNATSNYFNVFPQNSARTTYIPVSFGVRF